LFGVGTNDCYLLEIAFGGKRENVFVVLEENDGVCCCCAEELTKFGGIDTFFRGVEWYARGVGALEQVQDLYESMLVSIKYCEGMLEPCGRIHQCHWARPSR
jgi:hypothetical protein